KRVFVCRAIFPKLAPSLPICAESFIMRDGVLNDESFHSLRVCKQHAKTDRTAVILHVKRVARESQRFGEVIYDLGDMIERVRELFRVRPVAMSEARVIGCNKMKSIGEPEEKGFAHPRRRWQSVEQENGWRILRSRFSIKN